jgi:hypothetical protein
MKKILSILFLFVFAISLMAQPRVINHNCINLNQIPDEFITKAKSDLHIYFGHKSHGTQLTTGGMQAIINYFPNLASKYAFNSTGANSALQIYEGDMYYPPTVGWEAKARAYFDSHLECNVAIWCPSNNFVNLETNAGLVGLNNAKAFIDTVEQFILEYGVGGTKNRVNPITFVYMTTPPLARYPTNWSQPMDKYAIGCYRADSLIKKHCIANNRWLYDFYDLSTHTPEGVCYGGLRDDYTYDPSKRALDDGTYSLNDANHTRANWSLEWVGNNSTTENALMAADNICTTCQHSDGILNGGALPANARLTCVMKGKAAWWLWASLAGWNNTDTVIAPPVHNPCDPDVNADGVVNSIDVNILLNLLGNNCN